MNLRLILAALAALALVASCRIHVTIWFFGHPVARPPVAGLLLAAIVLAAAGLAWLCWRNLRGFRSTPYLRTVT
ncbi:MAG TPA: hypothetical protein VMK84_36450 [Streptosporangiaceae bacterium]|nr:hypothetical protein [Streptosporangiaceae bacterium]